MNIMYVSDEKYAVLLGISLTSLYENNQKADRLDVYIIDDGIREENIRKLKDTAEKYNRVIRFIKKPDMSLLLKCNPDTKRWCDNIFCRLYVPTILSDYPEVRKILYLDCDTVVYDELQKLWDMDLNGCVCAAGLECMGNFHKKLIGMLPSVPYVNSGVILIDIDRWEEIGAETKCTEFLKCHEHRLEYPDEGVLNGALNGYIKIFPPKYNLTSLKCTYTYKELKVYRKSQVMYSEEDYKHALEKPAIIHYTSNFLVRRPWEKGSGNTHYFEKIFKKYQMCSYWRDSHMPEPAKGKIRKAARYLARNNRRMVIGAGGILYSYIKPLKFYI